MGGILSNPNPTYNFKSVAKCSFLKKTWVYNVTTHVVAINGYFEENNYLVKGDLQ